MMEHVRATVGDEVELLHDIHERLQPIDAVQFAKDVEPFKLFFLEDALAPGGHRVVRAHPRAVRHAAGHGRVVQQSARVAAADLRTG